MESMETDAGGEKNHPTPSGDSVLPQHDEPSLITTSVSSHSPESSAVSVEKNVESPAVTTQEVENNSSEKGSKDLRQKELSDVNQTEDKSNTSAEETHPEKDLQTEQEPATVGLVSASSSASSSSSSSSPKLDTTVVIEAVSLNPESEKPSCNVNPTSICDTEHALGNAKADLSETITEMDVDASPDDVTGAETNTCDDGELHRGSDMTAVSEEAGGVQLITTSSISPTVTDSVRDSDAPNPNAEKGLEMGKSLQDFSGLGHDSEDSAVPKHLQNKECVSEDTDLPEDNPSSSGSSDAISRVSNENTAERLDSDSSMKPLREEDGHQVQGTEGADVKDSPSGSDGDNRPLSPCKSSPSKMEDGESHADQESDQAETPSKTEADIETLNSEILAHHVPSPSDKDKETKTVNCESLNKNTHSVCRQLSPTCLLPSVKLHTVETRPSPVKLNINGNSGFVSTDKRTLQPVLNVEEGGVIENTTVKDLPQNSLDANNHKVSKCKLGTVSPSTSSQQSDVATDGRNKRLETSSPSPCKIREEEPSPTADSATAQPPHGIGHVLSEMGPPLPRLLTPLSTPPKVGKSINPRQAIGKLSFPSPMERLASPTTPVQAHLTPNSRHLRSTSLNSPLPPSSPLQFGSATPKHAVPVPGRLPVTAMNSSPSSSSSPSQENSMRILDTMYPELSAHARTLNILRGNVGLGICSPESRTLPTTVVSQMSGFKSINSSSTAFTKTETRGGKRQSIGPPQPKSSKCLRLDDCSPAFSREQVPSSSSHRGEETTTPPSPRLTPQTMEAPSPSMEVREPAEKNAVVNILKKIEHQHFDLLPVIQSHMYVGNLPKKPVLRGEEKEVIDEILRSTVVSVLVYRAHMLSLNTFCHSGHFYSDPVNDINVINIDHPFAMQCSAEKPWVLAFTWMFFDKYHTSGQVEVVCGFDVSAGQ